MGSSPKKNQAQASAAVSSIRAGYRPPPKSSPGISIFTVFLFLFALGIAAVMTMIVLPKDFSSIKGYPIDEEDKNPARNLLRESLDTLVAHEGVLVISEEDMNRYLQRRVIGKQGGVLGNFMRFEGVFVDFKKGYAEPYVERSVFGYPFTVSCRVKMDKFNGRIDWQLGKGGSIGSLDIPSKQLQPIIKIFQRLALVCQDELEIINKMGDIQFEEDKMILNPRSQAVQ